MRLPRYIHTYGDNALLLEWEQRISPDINQSVHAFANVFRDHPAVTACVPAYASLLLSFAGTADTAYALREAIFLTRPEVTSPTDASRTHLVPVCYGGLYGPDLDEVAARTGLLPEEVISLHGQREYLVYFLGFRPGFAFMGETDQRLAVARKLEPRPVVEGGSVGLAGRQTGIYPDASPGGWQLIGQCPLDLLDGETSSTRFLAGDRVRFSAISPAEFLTLKSSPPPWPVH